jgi:hypothetical protein
VAARPGEGAPEHVELTAFEMRRSSDHTQEDRSRGILTMPRPSGDVAAQSAADEEREAEEQLLLAFAPLYKRAFGIAMGMAGALVMFALTLSVLLRSPASHFPLNLLDEYFYGYSVSWRGLVIGTAWGFGVGFVIGWFIAFCRNLALAISIFTIRARAELTETRDFLDHI